jgi:hypothetical protein
MNAGSEVQSTTDEEKATSVVLPTEPEEFLEKWSTEKLEDEVRKLSNEYVEGLSHTVPSTPHEMVKSMKKKLKNRTLVMSKSVTIEKLTGDNASLLVSRIRSNDPYAPFPDRRSLVDYCKKQCIVVNQSSNIRIVPSGYNPWAYYVIMVPSTSYLSGTPIVGIMTLPTGFPRSAPTFTYIYRPSQLGKSTPLNPLVAGWGKNKLCHRCKECMEQSTSCNVCSSDECKALAAEHKEWDYYCTWDTILQSFMLFYINVYGPQTPHRGTGDVFRAESYPIIKQTIMNQWSVYLELFELFENNPYHFPKRGDVMYGKIIDSSPLDIVCTEGTMVSVPGVSIPPAVLDMGWKPKGRGGEGSITYRSIPMTLEETSENGYSVILLPCERLFSKREYFGLSFTLSTGTQTKNDTSDGLNRILEWDTRGYKMKKEPHRERQWSNHGSMLEEVFAIWLTFAEGRFVVSIQKTKTSLPCVLSEEPVGILSEVFGIQDVFYLNIIMKTYVPKERFKLKILSFAKGVVCDYPPIPIPTHRKMCAALVLRNSYVLFEEARRYVDTSECNGDSKDLEEKHPEFQVGVDMYSRVRNAHLILGHTNDSGYDKLLKHWENYKSNNLYTEVKVDSIHFDDNVVAFRVETIEPGIESLRKDYQYIVIWMKPGVVDEDYVYKQLIDSPTYETFKLKNSLCIDTRLMFLHLDV